MDTYADNLAELMESLDLKDVMLVGDSTGGEWWRATLDGTGQSAWPRSFWSAR
jgi:hypothetical protein